MIEDQMHNKRKKREKEKEEKKKGNNKWIWLMHLKRGGEWMMKVIELEEEGE